MFPNQYPAQTNDVDFVRKRSFCLCCIDGRTYIVTTGPGTWFLTTTETGGTP